MNDKRFWSAVLALLLLFNFAAVAETDYVDLSERFSDTVTFERDGQTYYMKNRITTVLAMGFNPTPSGAGALELVLLIAIDDNAKTVVPLQVDPSTLVDWMDEADAGEGAVPVPEGATLADLFGAQDGAEDGCARVMEALNGLFPVAVIEKCVALDLDGLTVIDGAENDGVNTVGDALMERLHVVKAIAEESDDPTELLSALSGYLYTEMKSGALMKIADKVDRYEVQPRTPLPVLEQVEESAPTAIDRNAFTDMMLNIYFDNEPMW